jgi:hypothetical protein
MVYLRITFHKHISNPLSTIAVKSKAKNKHPYTVVLSFHSADYVISTAIFLHTYSQDSSISTETGYGPDGLGSIPGIGKRLFSSPRRPDLLWSSPSLFSNGGSFLGRKAV